MSSSLAWYSKRCRIETARNDIYKSIKQYKSININLPNNRNLLTVRPLECGPMTQHSSTLKGGCQLKTQLQVSGGALEVMRKLHQSGVQHCLRLDSYIVNCVFEESCNFITLPKQYGIQLGLDLPTTVPQHTPSELGDLTGSAIHVV